MYVKLDKILELIPMYPYPVSKVTNSWPVLFLVCSNSPLSSHISYGFILKYFRLIH